MAHDAQPTIYAGGPPRRGERVGDRQPGGADRPSGSGGRPTHEGAEPGRAVLFLGGLRVTELARRVVHEIQKDDCLGRAAQLAYYFLFALFPFFLVLITLLGYLPIPNLMDRLM